MNNKEKKLSTKDKVYNLLRDRANTFVSGQEIASELSLTRAAIWKAINGLRLDNHQIKAINNRGYCLVLSSQPLSGTLIERELGYAKDKIKVIFLEQTESTNEDAKRIGNEGADEEGTITVVVSDYQSKGKGRRGRSFASPKGTGLYMSFLLHPSISPDKAYMLTCAAAIAVSAAIEKITGIVTAIKWVNDIYIEDKKICGILTEGSVSMETGALDYAVVGIGVNIFAPLEGFPEEIRNTAGAIYENGEAVDNVRNRICAAIIDEFIEIIDKADNNFVKIYREKSNLIGRYVKVNPYGDSKKALKGYAKVLDITDSCELVVEYDNGDIEYLSSGEVSVKKY